MGPCLRFRSATAGAAGGAHAGLGWLAGALVFIVPFALRGLGGGDVKLFAAAGTFLIAAAMAFPAGYIPDRLTKRDRVRLAGNAVTPPVMAWLCGRLAQAHESAP